MKDEVIRFRVTATRKNQIDNRIKSLGKNMNITSYMENLIDQDLASQETMITGECKGNSVIRFSLPDQYGVTCFLDSDEYSLYPLSGRFSDEFLDLLKANRQNQDVQLLLYADEEKEKNIQLVFTENNLCITRNGFYKNYNISFSEFADAFLSHMKKYAIYFAAPCNYKAIMLKPFDEMVKKMQTYQEKADVIVKKIG